LRAFLLVGVGTTLALQLGASARFPAAAAGYASLPRVQLARMQAPVMEEEAMVAPVAAVVPLPVGMNEVEYTQQVAADTKYAEPLRQVINRAEFWTNETATVLEIINVIGRWETHADFFKRTEFSEPSYREEGSAQGETEKRHQMALKMGVTERVALYQNAPKLPFTNERLAASVGLTCDDFNQMPVTMSACNVVYDALAESRSGLIPYDVCNQRRTEWMNADGSFNQARFTVGLAKSRSLVIVAWFMFGKGNFVWILVMARALADIRPDLFAFLNPATEEGKILWKAFAIL